MRRGQSPSGKLRRIPSGNSDDPTPRQLWIAVGQMILTFIAIVLSLRLPVPLIAKVLIAVLLLLIGARWIIRQYKRS